MKYITKEKNKKLYFAVLIFTFIIVLISTTLSYFTLVKSQKEEGTKLYTGKLEINYIDGIYIKEPHLSPRGEPDYNTYENVYRNNFIVTSSGTLDQTISIDMIITQNEFPSGTIKYMIFNSKGEKMASGSIKKDRGEINLVNNLYLAYNGQAKYTLMLWYSDTGYDQTNEMGLSLYGKINVYSKQIKY